MTEQQETFAVEACLIDQIGHALFGENYKGPLAAALGVRAHTVRDWASGRMRPQPGVWVDLRVLLDARRPVMEDASLALATWVEVTRGQWEDSA